MRASFFQFLFILIAGTSVAQYDLGVSAGTFTQSFDQNYFHHLEWPWSVALHYRERVAAHTDLGFDVAFVNTRFQGGWSIGGLGSGTSYSAKSIDLKYLQLSPYLDVRMDPLGKAVVRFGPQLGWKVSETLTGKVHHWSMLNTGSTADLDGSATDHFNTIDLRLMIGIGFRFGQQKNAVIMDLYFSHGLSTLIEARFDREKLNMLGIRLGIVRRIDRKTFSRQVRDHRPVKPESEP